MTGLRKKKFHNATQLYDEGEFDSAEAALQELWTEFPHEYEVFYLLLDIYKAQEKWNVAEDLIFQYRSSINNGSVLDEALLDLYLDMQDIERAWEITEKTIAEAPDLSDGILDIGFKFHYRKLGPEYLNKLENCAIPGFDHHIAIAEFLNATKSDYVNAIKYVEKALEINPDNSPAQYYLESLKARLMEQKIKESRNILRENATGDAVAAAQQVYELQPDSVVSQEYYLSALACKYFPPFRIYFHGNNFVGAIPYEGKAIIFLLFFLVCTLYYKDGVAVGGTNHLKPVVQLFSLLVLPRYLIFPLVVQVLALKHLRGFHLLKRPIPFLNGLIILLTWAKIFELSFHSPVNGMDYFLAAGMMTYVLLFSFASDKEQSRYKSWALGYGITAISLGILSYYKFITDGFLFLLFGGWVIPIFASIGLGYFEKLMQKSVELKKNSSDGYAAEMQKRPRLTFFIHIASIITASAGLGLFLLARMKWKFAGISMIFFSLPLMMQSITIFSFTELNTYNPDFGWQFQNNKKFRFAVILLSIGMYAGSIYLGIYGDIIIRKNTAWIPGVALFLGSWIGLFLVHYKWNKREVS